MLSDEKTIVLKKYNAWGLKKFLGKSYHGIIRTTVLINEKGKIIYNKTNRTGDLLKTKTRNLGVYTIGIDKKAPSIKAKNFSSSDWISNNKYLKIKINDDISGIKNYRATVNGDWILMEYDPKTNTLTHDFNDGIINRTENKLELIVTDNVGNSSKFESYFYRKLKD